MDHITFDELKSLTTDVKKMALIITYVRGQGDTQKRNHIKRLRSDFDGHVKKQLKFFGHTGLQRYIHNKSKTMRVISGKEGVPNDKFKFTVDTRNFGKKQVTRDEYLDCLWSVTKWLLERTVL